ncbi:unnamed protein product [Schistosoma turkestanicum]|nr:unnamed protein product [Schistosoma turkestanicum]
MLEHGGRHTLDKLRRQRLCPAHSSRRNPVSSTASTNRSPSADSRANRNLCGASSLSAGLSNSIISRPVTVFHAVSSVAPSRLSCTAFASPPRSVPSTVNSASGPHRLHRGPKLPQEAPPISVLQLLRPREPLPPSRQRHQM